MEIKNLSKVELVNLKQEIEDRIKTIEIKEVEVKKDSLLSLKNGDKIFGIRLSFGGHRLKEPDELNGLVDVIDYCNIEGVNLKDKTDTFSISISHPTKPFGISTTLLKKDYENEHCYLSIDLMKTGYDGFYTLKPKTWKEDLIRMLNRNIENRKKYFQEDLDLLNSKLELFINSEEKINEYI
jgi:hypothetical protein